MENSQSVDAPGDPGGVFVVDISLIFGSVFVYLTEAPPRGDFSHIEMKALSILD